MFYVGVLLGVMGLSLFRPAFRRPQWVAPFVAFLSPLRPEACSGSILARQVSTLRSLIAGIVWTRQIQSK
jgi:hypothetical protein